MMPDIYRRAQRALAYLDLEDNITKQWFFNMRNDPDLLKFTEGANELAVRPWFNRVWVKQEVAVAKAVQLICGHVEVSEEFQKWTGLNETYDLRGQSLLDSPPRISIASRPIHQGHWLALQGPR
jgi:hypothetical protein